MGLTSFENTTFGKLPLGAGFADPCFDNRRTVRAARGSIDDFTTFYARHGLFLKIHADYAYRSGRSGNEETIIRYDAAAEVIFSCVGVTAYAPLPNQLTEDVMAEIMRTDPAGTTLQHLHDCFGNYGQKELDAALARLVFTHRYRTEPTLARLDGPFMRLTLDGVRRAIALGMKYDPSRKVTIS